MIQNRHRLDGRHGFTLVETMVVLLISTLILSLSLLIAHDFNLNHFRNYLFWRNFQSEFQLYENLARRHHATVTLIFNSDDHRVYFTSLNRKICRHVIKEPDDLSTKRNYRIPINNDGHVSPAKVVWMTDHRPCLNQNFQLGWGMYTIEDAK